MAKVIICRKTNTFPPCKLNKNTGNYGCDDLVFTIEYALQQGWMEETGEVIEVE